MARGFNEFSLFRYKLWGPLGTSAVNHAQKGFYGRRFTSRSKSPLHQYVFH